MPRPTSTYYRVRQSSGMCKSEPHLIVILSPARPSSGFRTSYYSFSMHATLRFIPRSKLGLKRCIRALRTRFLYWNSPCEILCYSFVLTCDDTVWSSPIILEFLQTVGRDILSAQQIHTPPRILVKHCGNFPELAETVDWWALIVHTIHKQIP